MKTYIYTTKTSRTHLSGGRTRTYNVMRLKQNIPNDMGQFKVNTASYAGDYPSLKNFIRVSESLPLCEQFRLICVGTF